VNEIQSKFLEGTRPISQLRHKPSLSQLSQDYIAIKKLLAIGTGLGTTETQRKTAVDASKVTCESKAAKNELKGSSSSHKHFIEHLVGVLEKQQWELN
jgi:hypothetical protein